jgi:N-acetyl-anhydromuramyl-L-alanine amidase AmpD
MIQARSAVSSAHGKERNHMLPKLLWKQSPNYNHGRAITTFMNKHAEVSAHIVLREDGAEATQMVGFRDKAWHCKIFNSTAIGIEMAGFIAKGMSAAEWQEAAEITAYLCHRFSVPIMWSKDGKKPGVCRHADLGKAGGGHTDPTQDLSVWRSFLNKVEVAYNAAQWPKQPWGRD